MIRKAALIGAGAVGCYLIDCLMDMEGTDFCVIASGERRARLEQSGVCVNGRTLHPPVRTPEEAGEQDLILIATKTMALEEAIACLPAMMGKQTLVMSLLNGVDSEERVAAAVGQNHVVYSLMRIASERRGGQVSYRISPEMGVFFGILPGQDAPASEAIGILSEFFGRTRLFWHAEEDILTDIWYKYASNIANNLPQAILGVPAKLYQTEDGLYLLNTLWREVRAVAQTKGIDLPEAPCVWNQPASRYSTLQDLDAGRKTEIDMFTGTLMRMAEQAGIAVPCAATVHHLIRALELKNEGFYAPAAD